MTTAAARDDLLVRNGIDVDTGGYLSPAFAVTDLAEALRGDGQGPPGARDLR